MVYFMAGYTNIPYDVFEAARIDGATRGQYFWKIALPLLIPSIKSAAILSMVGSLKYFDLIYVMNRWRSWYCYRADGNLYVQRIIQEL